MLLAVGPSRVPAQRDGDAPLLPVRLSPLVLSRMAVAAGGTNFTVPAASVPTVSQTTSSAADVHALLVEAFLLLPMLGPPAAGALAGQGSANNPAAADAAALNTAQGGLSPLEGGPVGLGSFALMRTADYQPAANPSQVVSMPVASGVPMVGRDDDRLAHRRRELAGAEFVHGAGAGPRGPVPFGVPDLVLPLWPPKWGDGQSYTADDLTRYFELDGDVVAFTYAVLGGVPPTFAAANWVEYDGAIVLSWPWWTSRRTQTRPAASRGRPDAVARGDQHARRQSPIFVWVVPNHLGQSLSFCNADGSAVGSCMLHSGAIAYQSRRATWPTRAATRPRTSGARTRTWWR